MCEASGKLSTNNVAFYRKGHYSKALAEAISSNQSQWPPGWNGKNPLNVGCPSFNDMGPQEKVK